MGEILHSQLTGWFQKSSGQTLPCVYLIHGQEMLVEQSSLQLVAKLLDGASADICCEKIDGLIENLPDALERLNTFALLSGPKIVIFTEAKLFEGRGSLERMAERIVEAWEGGDAHHAAQIFMGLCVQIDIDPEEAVREINGNGALKSLGGQLGLDVIEQLIDKCRSIGRPPASAGNPAESLLVALDKGFPSDHYLIVTAHSKVPKNLKLYKAFRDHGAVIDCNIPKGERRSDKVAQEAVLRRTLDELLAKAKKQLSPGSFQSLCRLTGFDPRTFVQNIGKLIDYVGQRSEITEEDIRAVVNRTKADPVFELTNAVADRDLVQSLFYTRALLDAKWHPLQILSALANQMRKLLVAKSFTASDYGKCWVRGMSYPQFQNSVMPAIEAYDNQSREDFSRWQTPIADGAKKGRARKKSAPDIVLAANPKSPYPVYQTLLKSDKFTLEELTQAMLNLNATDLRLKSSGQDAAMVLKKTIMEICQFVFQRLP